MDEGKIYKIVCPHCQKEQHACKSMFQKMGSEAGIVTCLHCDKLMILTYDRKNDAMEAGKWEIISRN